MGSSLTAGVSARRPYKSKWRVVVSAKRPYKSKWRVGVSARRPYKSKWRVVVSARRPYTFQRAAAKLIPIIRRQARKRP